MYLYIHLCRSLKIRTLKNKTKHSDTPNLYCYMVGRLVVLGLTAL